MGSTGVHVTPTATVAEGGPSDRLPHPPLWQPSPNDVAPDVKARAVQMVEIAASWSAGDSGDANARRRLSAAGYDPDLASSLQLLLAGGAAAVARVVVAQYGGILVDTASVLTVVRQWVAGQDGPVSVRGTTLDIRLIADDPQWMVTTVRPARPGRPTAQLSPAAQELLANDRVTLPAAATADVRSGVIDDSVFGALNALSRHYRLDVSVLRSGHPLRVFGTDRISNHTEGRAVDVWALDGRPIIDVGESRAVAAFMRAASDAGAYQVGGPVDRDGAGASYFTDDTHRDHIHLGFPS